MSVCETSTDRSTQIKARLAAIQAELDQIGPTVGMQRRRVELRGEKDALLDELLSLLSRN
jgi:hypothetical protein